MFYQGSGRGITLGEQFESQFGEVRPGMVADVFEPGPSGHQCQRPSSCHHA